MKNLNAIMMGMLNADKEEMVFERWAIRPVWICL